MKLLSNFMYHKHQTEGLVIQGFESGDSSKKIAIFTRELGLIYAQAQNSRALCSKLRLSVQDFTLGEFVLIKGIAGWKVTGASKTENIFGKLRSAVSKLRIANNISNLLKVISNESGSNHEIFDALKYFMRELPELSEYKIKLAEYAVLLKIMNEMGYLRENSKFSGFIKEFRLEEDFFRELESNRSLATKMINESLRALETKM